MKDLDHLILTHIEPPMVVHSEKGRVLHMKKRAFFALSLCMSGQITYIMNGKKYISNAGNAVILPQDGSYSLYGDKEGLFPVLNFRCENLDCKEIRVFPLENPQVCIQKFEELQELFLHNKSKFKIYSTFYDLLEKAVHQSEEKRSPLSHIIQYVEENIQNPELSNVKLAEQIGISEVYLRKLFLSHYNTTPKQFILDIRIRKAKQLLVDTPLAVVAIAEECGFSSVYHFCRSFKQRTGQTPTQYAAANRIYKI